MYKFSRRGLSAFLFTVAHDTESGQRAGMPFNSNSNPWLSLIEVELTENDQLTISDGSSFEILLADADESKALKIARLIRNSFQLHVAPENGIRLSTGVVLFSKIEAEKTKFSAIAQGLAKKHSSDVGNTIAFENYGTADVDEPELPE